ncbi:DNA polymerase III subunit delta [Candidatus Poriferisocius sp.]|uniref:DNA polymerase III subunit delta n=1 Tax=Candidatus Poriferisocius sp. TaxID=3101276 RepID=UPI003B5AB2BE
MSATVVLVHGGDDVLLGNAVRDRVSELVGDGDRSLMVAELNEAAYLEGEEYVISPLADAAQTPPFLTERRVVVGRELGRFASADALKPLLGYLADPLATTDLVLVWEKGPALQRLGAVPKKLSEAVTAAGGEVIGAGVPRGRDGTGKWMDAQIAAAGLRLRAGAKRLLADHLGEDMSRLPGLLATLGAAHGPDRALDVDDVAPFIGEAGSVPPWELTDAVASGKIPEALDKLRRMLHAGGRNEMQVLASLSNHYARLLRLDGADVVDEKQAAELLGIKGSTFPARKALNQSRKLGTKRVARSFELLAQADLDLRGATALPPEAVLEVLVARLTQLNR